MYILKNGNPVEISNIYAVKNKTVRIIKNAYSIVKGNAVLIWTALKNALSGVFSKGYWVNSESWNNEDSWKNNN